jgi:S-adenosylmethionine hydrolase
MITLTTDFGYQDPYVAEMKGVIFNINPEAKVIDVTHGVGKFDVSMAAFILASVAPYFPKGTIHLAIVDPGVGTQRRSIVVETNAGFLVGPDNGVLILTAKNQGIKHIYQIVNPQSMLSKVSNTFHGRDVFAPAVAYLDKGVLAQEVGPEITDPVTPTYAKVKRTGKTLRGEVLQTDSFGNIITNINRKEVETHKTLKINFPNATLNAVFVQTYSEAKLKEPLALIGSHGFLEIALNQGNAAEKFCVKAGATIKVGSA